jgi:mannose-1-phosphate guanylyltransferase / mannose-6-phosphate isomerase
MARMSGQAGQIYPVILSGGSGTRLWPLSRALYPKQLLPLLSQRSLLQEAALRVADSDRFAPPVVIANDDHRFIVAEHLRFAGIRPHAVVLEPIGRNTAPAVCVAALHLTTIEPGALMLVLPSDHAIRDVARFLAAVDRGAVAARQGRLITFGITADRPETGYGYIRAAAPIDGAEGVHDVAEFVEKPDRERAQDYIAAGDYYWNSGIFLFPAALYLKELEAHLPGTVASCRAALDRSKRDLDFLRLDRTAFAAAENISVDYAVMEHTRHAAVAHVTMGWSDIGAWDALWQMTDKDEAGNVGQGDVILEDARNCYVRADHGLVTALGVENLVVIATADAVMVAQRDRAQDVKRIVARLERDGRSESKTHPLVHRPWGAFRSIHAGNRVQVKHIIVKPGAKLSLQMHHHRAEHWVIVHGTAKVVRGNEESVLYEDQSTYIPMGTPHRMENPGKIPLHFIEVQSGSYLGEDDIVRFEDTYGRS